MCEMLVKIVSNTHANRAKQDKGCFQRGDVMLIENDGHSWSYADTNSTKRMLLKVPGVKKDDMVSYLIPKKVSGVRTVQRSDKIDLDAASLALGLWSQGGNVYEAPNKAAVDTFKVTK